jgi:hypothetical protein
VPVDDEVFENINDAQWLWYHHNLLQDREEEFIRQRDLIEYHASFIEPEAVKKIRESREKAVEVNDKEFVAGLKHFFGRELTAEKQYSGKIESVDPTQAMNQYKTQKKKGENKLDDSLGYKHWLNSNLG